MRPFFNLSSRPDNRTEKPALPFAAAMSGKLEKLCDLRRAHVEEVRIQDGCRLAFHTDPSSPAADRFRYLRIRLRELWNTGKLKSVLIASALPQDGKSTVALNLASALCEQGRRNVLLIEADLHRPSLTAQLGLTGGAGVVECLETGANPLPLVRWLEPLGWYLLPAGGECATPTELLQSIGVSELLAKLAPHFDWILIDSPPLIPITDGVSLARDVDATLLVVRAGSTPRDAVERSLALIGRKKLIGVILNGLEGVNSIYAKHGYYGNYASKSGAGAAAPALRPVPSDAPDNGR